MKIIASVRLVLLTLITLLFVSHAQGANLSVMKTGLGEGTITSDIAGINCGTAVGASNCEFTYGDVNVILTPNEIGGSNFVRWDGDCQGAGTGPSQTCTVRTDSLRLVRAKFDPAIAIAPLNICASGTVAPNHCSAGNIEDYLVANSNVDTPAEFIAAFKL